MPDIDDKWIATYPCGCIGAVSMAWYMSPRDVELFVRENAGQGSTSQELVTHKEYQRRGGISRCPHSPRWGLLSA